MVTLVLCIDREGSVDSATPAVGDDVVTDLVTDVGIEDPEDSRVNSLLESLKVARDLRAEGSEAVVAVVSCAGEGVDADRVLAEQVDDLVARYDPTGAVVVVDSAEDEQTVPIVESRVRVDAVDRVIVRQARDIESTYYLLKQVLGDEELRKTVLVPLGVILLAVPALLAATESVTVTVSLVAAVIGVFFLYKGLGVGDLIARTPSAVQRAFYAGRVSVVTYVVGLGLALVGGFVGVVGATRLDDPLLMTMEFAYESVPWFALGALAAATGRLLDEWLENDEVRSSFLNLPFGVVAIGFVVRGFAGFFLERATVIGSVRVPTIAVGAVTVDGFPLTPGMRLAVFVGAGLCISLLGVGVASYVSATTVEELDQGV
ncbi:DUF373 family protein [Halomarina ordinaria]|uniref:DUF373 family protein n=1 Tax=Halomarina ordinaria TaxID=3033939 RepID=A0ABD5U7S3_9EURY|nr:DUF373 family protein [Halomarina sp. PSRA2]